MNAAAQIAAPSWWRAFATASADLASDLAVLDQSPAT
jgi:hypothetical protein